MSVSTIFKKGHEAENGSCGMSKVAVGGVRLLLGGIRLLWEE